MDQEQVIIIALEIIKKYQVKLESIENLVEEFANAMNSQILNAGFQEKHENGYDIILDILGIPEDDTVEKPIEEQTYCRDAYYFKIGEFQEGNMTAKELYNFILINKPKS